MELIPEVAAPDKLGTCSGFFAASSAGTWSVALVGGCWVSVDGDLRGRWDLCICSPVTDAAILGYSVGTCRSRDDRARTIPDGR